jgi:hypothetical protein
MKHFLLITMLLVGMSWPSQLTESTSTTQQSTPAEPLQLDSAETAKLINECGEHTTQMTRRLYTYGFMATDTQYVLNNQAVVKREESKVYEVYPTAIGKRSRWIYIQVSENGVPFSAEKIARERERAAKQTMDLEEKASKAQDNQTSSAYKPRFSSYGMRVEKHRGPSKTIWFINPTDFLVSHDFFAPRRFTFNGREAILLNFRPRPNYVFDKTNVPYSDGVAEYGRVMSQLGGKVWIDARDKVIVRLEAKPIGEFNALDSSTAVAPDATAPVWFELRKLPDGTWAPSQSRYNSYGREDVFWKTGISRSLTYSDFKLFKTTAE